MAYEHLKLKVFPGEFKYVLFDDRGAFEQLLSHLRSAPGNLPFSIFQSAAELSAVVPSEVETKSGKEEPGWIGMGIVGEMPFGTVQGLIATLTTTLREAGVGVCVVSTFLTDLLFIKRKNEHRAVKSLEEAGWKFVR